MDIATDQVKLPPSGTAASIPPDVVSALLREPVRSAYLQPDGLRDDAPEPFRGPACDRVVDGPQLVSALDDSGMLWAGPHDGSDEFAAFFGVKKEWVPAKQHWLLRAILDRRARNARERQVWPQGPGPPHGSQLCELGPSSGRPISRSISIASGLLRSVPGRASSLSAAAACSAAWTPSTSTPGSRCWRWSAPAPRPAPSTATSGTSSGSSASGWAT